MCFVIAVFVRAAAPERCVTVATAPTPSSSASRTGFRRKRAAATRSVCLHGAWAIPRGGRLGGLAANCARGSRGSEALASKGTDGVDCALASAGVT